MSEDSNGDRSEPGEERPEASPAAGREPAWPEVPPAAPTPGRRDLLTVTRTQAALAGAAVLLLLGGGAGGFFIGHATGGDHGHRDFPGLGRAGFGPRGQADGIGRGQLPPGGSSSTGPGQGGAGQGGAGQG